MWSRITAGSNSRRVENLMITILILGVYISQGYLIPVFQEFQTVVRSREECQLNPPEYGVY